MVNEGETSGAEDDRFRRLVVEKGFGVVLEVETGGESAIYLANGLGDTELWTEDERYLVLTMPEDDGARCRLVIADFRGMSIRVSWDRYEDAVLHSLRGTILRISEKNKERPSPLDLRSMPWGKRAALVRIPWPASTQEQIAALRGLLASRTWRVNPAMIGQEDCSASPPNAVMQGERTR